jgi:hypothetical protein
MIGISKNVYDDWNPISGLGEVMYPAMCSVP